VEKYGKAEQATDDNKIWRMLIPCWITKAKNSEYVILISFVQKRLHESAPMLRYVYIACLGLVSQRPTKAPAANQGFVQFTTRA
jgi:hypothetical protein